MIRVLFHAHNRLRLHDMTNVALSVSIKMEKVQNSTALIYISFHFNFTSFRRVTLQQSWFSRGPPLKRKKNMYTAKIQ